jgi:truncated hemoglobin YjbI
MSGTLPPVRRGRDLDDRVEITEFVTRFYRSIAQDEHFHRYFHTIANVDWHAHTLELADFWSALLLGGPHESAVETIEAHRWLHDAEPFDTGLFELWIEILDATLDGGWSGPMTESARRRGRGLAWAMSKRLTGHAPRRAT